MEDKNKIDSAWCEWIGNNSDIWPQRACLGDALEGDVLLKFQSLW